MKVNNHRFRSQKGLTLIEIMISLLIGVFLIVGVIQLFINSKQTYRVQEALARLQESGRFALDFLDRDIRMAGFRGCASRGASAQVSNYLGSASSYVYDFTNPVQGFEAGTSAWNPTLPGAITSQTTPSTGKDIITIRRAAEDSAQVVSASLTDRRLTLNRNTIPGLKTCDVVMVSDCSHAAVFQISSFDSANKYANYASGGCSTSPAGGNAGVLDRTYVGGNLNKALTTSYFIKNNSNAQPALFRLSNSNAEEELVEGVEDMQIAYGQDTDGDGTANIYVKADGATWANIVSVRISLLLRTIDDNIAAKPISYYFDDTEKPAADKRIRRVFTSTIAIRNKLP